MCGPQAKYLVCQIFHKPKKYVSHKFKCILSGSAGPYPKLLGNQGSEDRIRNYQKNLWYVLWVRFITPDPLCRYFKPVLGILAFYNVCAIISAFYSLAFKYLPFYDLSVNPCVQMFPFLWELHFNVKRMNN